MKVFASFMRIGPPITDHAEPAYLKHGILTLTVGESAWLTELTFLRPQIIDRLNQGLAKPAVHDIRLRLGRLMKRTPPARARPPVLSAEQAAKVESWGALIPGEEVRRAVMRAAARSLSEPPPKRVFVEGPPGPRAAPSVKEEVPEEPRSRWPKDRDRWREKRKG